MKKVNLFEVLSVVLKLKPVVEKLLASLKDGKISKVEREEILKEAVESVSSVLSDYVDKKVSVE